MQTVSGHTSVRTLTDDFNFEMNDYLVRLDGTTKTVTGTLPEITSNWHGRKYIVKSKDITNTVKISCFGSDTFEDLSTEYIFTLVNESIAIVADNDNKEWVLIH